MATPACFIVWPRFCGILFACLSFGCKLSKLCMMTNISSIPGKKKSGFDVTNSGFSLTKATNAGHYPRAAGSHIRPRLNSNNNNKVTCGLRGNMWLGGKKDMLCTYAEKQERNRVVHRAVEKAHSRTKPVRHKNGQSNYRQANAREKCLKTNGITLP